MLSGIGFKRLNRILITHGHLDHILGLAGLLSTYMRWEAIDHLEIYAGAWALERIHDLLFGVVLRGARPPLDIRLIEVKPGVIFSNSGFTISAFPVYHRGSDCFGYLFEERPRRPFLSEKAEALGVPPGPWRKELVDGQQVTLPDGKIISPEQVLGEVRLGTRMAHIGDTGRVTGLEEVCRGVDALVIEATYLEQEADMANDFSHLTARQAAELARDGEIKFLFLTHVSRRYREKEVLAEARAIFNQSYVARDFDVYQIKRGECIQVKNKNELLA